MIARPTLEANVVRHCMNRCACCSHASPWAKPYFMPPEVLEQDLAALNQFMHVKQFSLLGGEPLLHPQLLDLLDVANASQIADEVCVLTNGRLFTKMPDEFWTKFDFLRISAYPNLDRAEITYAEGKSRQFGFGMGVDWPDKFWLQFEKTDGSHFAQCLWRDCCLTVHNHYLFLCPQSAFFPEMFMDKPFGTDGLSLEGLTEEKLAALFERKKPLETCHICHSSARQTDWHQCDSLEQWKKDSTL